MHRWQNPMRDVIMAGLYRQNSHFRVGCSRGTLPVTILYMAYKATLSCLHVAHDRSSATRSWSIGLCIREANSTANLMASRSRLSLNMALVCETSGEAGLRATVSADDTCH